MQHDRFDIEQVRTDAHDHYLCADYEWRVTDKRTGQTVFSFDEQTMGSAGEGVRNVSFSPDGKQLVVTWHDGKVTHVDLPA
jgi:WD40 repeat protein